MDEHIAKFAALMDRTGCRDADMAGYPARRRKLSEETKQAGFVLGHLRIEFRVAAFEIDVGDESRSAVSGAGHV